MSRCPCENKRNNKKSDHKQCNDKDYKKIKNLKTKNLQAQNLLACQIDAGSVTAQTGNFSDLSSNNLNVTNLNTTSINGRNLFCDDDFKISGVITPVEYVNGEPVQPTNPGGLDQRVLDQLWRLNLLANGFTNLDAADTRYKNYLLQRFYNCSPCPDFPPTGCTFSATNVALFNGSVNSLGTTGTTNILTVTEMLPVDIIPGNTEIGIIQIGQRVYPQNSETYFTVIEFLTGFGGVGTYRVSNSFNSAINLSEQRMLALKSNGLEECAAIPLRIYGVETIPYSNLGMSGMTGMTGVNPINTCGVSVVDAINYNINIANRVLNTRVAAVYLQVGWIGATGGVVVQGLSIDTKQFDLSILSFGEQMNNNFLIPDNIKPDLATGVVQIAVYLEDGLEVFIPENPQNILSRAIVAAPGQPTNYTVSFSTVNGNSLCNIAKSVAQLGPFEEPPLLRASRVSETLIPYDFSQKNNIGTMQVSNVGYYYAEFGETGAVALINIGESSAPGTEIQAVPGLYQGSLGGSIGDTGSVFIQPIIGNNVYSSPQVSGGIGLQCLNGNSSRILLTNGVNGGIGNSRLLGVYLYNRDGPNGTYNLRLVRPLQLLPGQSYTGPIVAFPLYIA